MLLLQAPFDHCAYSFGLDRRIKYSFGLDKRIKYSFGLDRRIKYSFGLDRRKKYSFGLDRRISNFVKKTKKLSALSSVFWPT